jgi:hypothetical protein
VENEDGKKISPYRKLCIINLQLKIRGGFMELNGKMFGYILYAVGIIGGVEGAIDPRQQNGILISIIAMVVIIIASYMLDKK